MTFECMTSNRVGWMQAWPEDGLHPLSCLHGHMCSFTDSPLANPANKSPPTRKPFSPPNAFTAILWMWWCLLLHDWLLPPPRRFPAHMAPPGSGQWPRRQDLNSEYAFLLPPSGSKAFNARDRPQRPYNVEWRDNMTCGERENIIFTITCLVMAPFKRKTDN